MKAQEERTGRDCIWRHNSPELIKLEGRNGHIGLSGRFGRPRLWGTLLQRLRDRDKEGWQKKVHILEVKDPPRTKPAHVQSSLPESKARSMAIAGKCKPPTTHNEASRRWVMDFPWKPCRLAEGGMIHSKCWNKKKMARQQYCTCQNCPLAAEEGWRLAQGITVYRRSLTINVNTRCSTQREVLSGLLVCWFIVNLTQT